MLPRPPAPPIPRTLGPLPELDAPPLASGGVATPAAIRVPVQRAAREGARGVATIIGLGVAAMVVVNVVSLPAWLSAHAVGLVIAGGGCATAVRWWRGGVRRQARSVFSERAREFGGGLYGILGAATWLYLEGADLVGDVAAAGSPVAWFDQLSIGWAVQQMVQSVGFAVQAAIWPWTWSSTLGVKTAALVAGAVWAVDAFVRKALPKIRARRAMARGVVWSEETP